MSDATSIVKRMRSDRAAAERELLPVVYEELKAQARRLMARQSPGHTLQPTALVHEGFLRLIEQEGLEWNDRAHFMAVAARAMRHVLVDHARGAGAQKRGGAWHRVTLAGAGAAEDTSFEVELLDLEEALEEMGELDPRQTRMVEMRFFAGMSNQEIAYSLDLHRNTVSRELDAARSWLLHRLAS